MGYDTELFVQQPVDANLLCVICHSVQQKPTVACKNGHTFCSTCICTWEKESSECPDCRSPIVNKVVCLPVQNLVKALQVHCPVKVEKEVKDQVSGPQTRAQKRARVENGIAPAPKTTTVCCGWEGTLSDYLEKHQTRQCGLRKVGCPLGCREVVLACDLDEHKETDCKNRTVTCNLCNKLVLERQLDRHHEKSCQDAMTSCEYCGESMLRKLLGTKPSSISPDDLPQGQTSDADQYTKHYEVCPKMTVTCEFHAHGCKEKLKREDLDEHHVKFARKHASLVSEEMQQMERDKVWAEENMSWGIPTAVLIKAHQTPTGQEFVLESQRVPVGDYQAFLRLTIFNGIVISVGVGVDRPMFEPSIDRLKISCKDALLEKAFCQDMNNDGGGIWSVEGGFTYSVDDDVFDVSLDNLLDWAADNDDKCVLYAQFRLRGPADADYRCVGCQLYRINHARSPSY